MVAFWPSTTVTPFGSLNSGTQSSPLPVMFKGPSLVREMLVTGYSVPRPMLIKRYSHLWCRSRIMEPPVKGHSVRFVAAVWLTFAPEGGFVSWMNL